MAEAPEIHTSAVGANPYAPAIAEPIEEQPTRRIHVLPVVNSGGPPGCSYITSDEFCAIFTEYLVEACALWDVEARGDDPESEHVLDSAVRCCVHEITPYRITFWQRVLKCLPLPFGYSYFPAAFVISGTIESPHHPTIQFCTRRKSSERKLSEKANMLMAMRSEAVRIISKAARALDRADPTPRRGPFWTLVLMVPIVTATLAAVGVYSRWDLVCQLVPTIGDSPHTNNSKTEAGVHAGLVFAIIAPLLVACAPQWVYADRRARFAYSFVNTTRSIVLRAVFATLALPSALILGLSLLPRVPWSD